MDSVALSNIVAHLPSFNTASDARDSAGFETLHASPPTTCTVYSLASYKASVGIPLSFSEGLCPQSVTKDVSSTMASLGSGAIRQLEATLCVWGWKFSIIRTVEIVTPFSVCYGDSYYYFLLGCYVSSEWDGVPLNTTEISDSRAVSLVSTISTFIPLDLYDLQFIIFTVVLTDIILPIPSNPWGVEFKDMPRFGVLQDNVPSTGEYF